VRFFFFFFLAKRTSKSKVDRTAQS